MSLAIRRLALVGVVLGVLATACVPDRLDRDAEAIAAAGSDIAGRDVRLPAGDAGRDTHAHDCADLGRLGRSVAGGLRTAAAGRPVAVRPIDGPQGLGRSDRGSADVRVREPVAAGTGRAHPRGRSRSTTPPYTQAGSGAAIVMIGRPCPAGPLQRDVAAERHRTADLFRSGRDPSRASLPSGTQSCSTRPRAIVGWYVGYDGSGCVSFARDGNDITLTIDHA